MLRSPAVCGVSPHAVLAAHGITVTVAVTGPAAAFASRLARRYPVYRVSLLIGIVRSFTIIFRSAWGRDTAVDGPAMGTFGGAAKARSHAD